MQLHNEVVALPHHRFQRNQNMPPTHCLANTKGRINLDDELFANHGDAPRQALLGLADDLEKIGAWEDVSLL